MTLVVAILCIVCLFLLNHADETYSRPIQLQEREE